MSDRVRWQYCQIEVGANSIGQLRQFFPDREAVVTELYDNWPGMLAKLGDQGWEIVSVFPNEGGRGRSPLTYVLKRPLAPGSSYPAPPPPPPEATGPTTEFEPLRGS